MLLCRITLLCHQSLITMDAVVRTTIRITVTHRRLLEWETADQAELKAGSTKGTVEKVPRLDGFRGHCHRRCDCPIFSAFALDRTSVPNAVGQLEGFLRLALAAVSEMDSQRSARAINRPFSSHGPCELSGDFSLSLYGGRKLADSRRGFRSRASDCCPWGFYDQPGVTSQCATGGVRFRLLNAFGLRHGSRTNDPAR